MAVVGVEAVAGAAVGAAAGAEAGVFDGEEDFIQLTVIQVMAMETPLTEFHITGTLILDFPMFLK